MEIDYLKAWSVYLAAVAVLQFLFWLLVRKLASRDVRQILQLCLFAFLICPARLDPDNSYWAPAFMAALMESIDSGIEAGLNRLWPILLLMLVLVVVSLLWRVVFRSRS